ncbi:MULTISPECIES: hypothetical protein [unclassified Streptomyces]|uniref:hypothetical protein n=1 Tax=unclassified Streptomyces TaxID=2593676 RepID=UPI0004BF9778|nr:MULTISPECIES: hypothetical protein [unclassified Streptomyces]
MNHQHDTSVNASQSSQAGLQAQARQAVTPRHVRVSVGKHFDLTVSLSVSPTFLMLLAAAVGVAGGNCWFLL